MNVRDIVETIGISKDNVGKRNLKEFLRRFVTADETQIHWYTPETKERRKSVIYVDYLEKGDLRIFASSALS